MQQDYKRLSINSGIRFPRCTPSSSEYARSAHCSVQVVRYLAKYLLLALTQEGSEE